MVQRPPELYGVNISELARICRVSLKTAIRWKDGTTCPPATALMVLSGDLACFAPEWSGWRVRGGELFSPEGWSITVADVRASPLLRAQLAVYQAENRNLRDLRDSMDEQPLPGECPVEIVA